MPQAVSERRRYVRLHPGTKRPADRAWQSNPLPDGTVDPAARGVHLGASGEIVVDEDEFGAVLKWLASRGEVLPATHVVRTASGKHHYYYRVPEGWTIPLKSRIRVDGFSLDLLAGMRQVVGAGTVLADGSAYAVVDGREPVAAPDWLLRLLLEDTELGEAVSTDTRSVTPRSVAARQWSDAVAEVAAVASRGSSTGVWDRDALLRLSTHLAKLGGEQAYVGWEQGFARAGVPQNGHDEELIGSAVRRYGAAADQVVDDAELWADGSTAGFFSGAQAPVDAGQRNVGVVDNPATSQPVLPESFWAARPVLAHIRQAAHSRACSADAVLGVVLARLASLVPGRLRVETGLRAPMPVSTYAVLLGASGTGKSSAAAAAMGLLPSLAQVYGGAFAEDDDAGGYPLGSGEGLCDIYMERVSESDPEGGPRKVSYRQVRANAFFHADEGASVFDIGKRTGSTLLSTLRSAWSGGRFGQANTAAGGNKRIVDNATLGLWVGLQQPHAAALIGGENVTDGTTQRFVWFSSTDPTIPAHRSACPPHPGPLPVRVLEHTEIGVDPAISDEVWERQSSRSRGELVAEVGREQDDALRFRLAALLALLENRGHVERGDWDLAGVLVDTSASQVAHIRAAAAADARREAAARTQARQDERAADADHDDALFDLRVETIVGKIAERLAVKGPEGRARLAKGVARQHADEFDVALVLAVDRGLVVVTSDDRGNEIVAPTGHAV